MTTFSMMSVPDKKLSLQAYSQLLLYYATFKSLNTECTKGMYDPRMKRLEQLIDALLDELAKEQ